MESVSKTNILIGNKKVDDLVFRETVSKYEQTRRRVTRFNNNFSMSDKEIIEYLAEEIEQYRNRIECQNKTIQSKEITLDTTDDELIDEDIVEIISTTQYAYGKPIMSKMEYKYKESKNKHELNTCPPIEIGYTKAY